MIRIRIIILFLVMAAVVTAWTLPGRAEQKDKSEENIWTEEGSLRPERGPGRGLVRGRGAERGPGPEVPRRFELTDEEIDRIMSSLEKSDPNAAIELEKLRKKDPEKFQAEIRKHGREEFGKIIGKRIEGWRRQRQNDFLQWLEKNYPKEVEKLTRLKEKEPELYMEKSDLIRNKYWRIFEEEKRNPELAEVLKEDLKLKDKRDELVITIKAAKNEKDKQKLLAELEEVVGRRYDLIVRQKEIAYERLLKWLEELRNRVRESRDEINRCKDERVKIENVKKHIKDLTEETSPPFRWE
jgi:hypothetical protein